MDDSDDIRRPADGDATVEAAILQHLLALHPATVTSDELLREIAADPGDFAQRDAVERGLRDLVATGLLHREGKFLQPSRAAVRLDELLGS